MGPEFIIGVIIATIGSIAGIFFYGRKVGYKEMGNEVSTKSLKELIRVADKNRQIEEADARARKDLPIEWPDSGVIELPKTAPRDD